MKKTRGYNLNTQLLKFDDNYQARKKKLEQKYHKLYQQKKTRLEKAVGALKTDIASLGEIDSATSTVSDKVKQKFEKKFEKEFSELRDKNAHEINKYIHEQLIS